MSQSLKTIKTRLRSIEGARKVMSAMEMMAAAKLNRVNRVFYLLKPYFSSLESLMNSLIASVPVLPGVFFQKRGDDLDTVLCLMTSDTGLCGSYNNNVIRAAEEFIRETGKERVRLILVGKKGFTYFRKHDVQILNSYIGFNGRYNEKSADEIMQFIIGQYLNGKIGQVYASYTQFKTALQVKPVIKKILPMENPSGMKVDYIFEPDIEAIFRRLIPRYLTVSFRLLLLESFASEHSSRVVAMKTATENAGELMDALTLLRNKVRQANITQEIMEIVSSVEALKG
ncbi:MAG: ATP synthase F1 subunit gamma [Candidatus Omnitrophica bacterium]|nr:ATP synthase F1 subunit gamma [Candidatus Omnitrophota bacterium]